MAGYKPLTNFRAKDILSPGNPHKLIVGAELQREFEAINSSIASMTDAYNGPLTNFAAKDLLATGNANKKVIGATLDAEFDAIYGAFVGVPGWSYTRITTFDGQTTILGDVISDELDAIGTALTSMWEAGSTGSTSSGGPFWATPVIGFTIVTGQLTANGSPISNYGYADVDATGFGFYNYLGGSKTSDNSGTGLTTRMWEHNGSFMTLIIEGPSSPVDALYTSLRFTDSGGTVRTATFASRFNTTTNGNMRRWAWDVSTLFPGIPAMTGGLTRTIEFIP
jgi:hypothetical protein